MNFPSTPLKKIIIIDYNYTLLPPNSIRNIDFYKWCFSAFHQNSAPPGRFRAPESSASLWVPYPLSRGRFHFHLFVECVQCNQISFFLSLVIQFFPTALGCGLCRDRQRMRLRYWNKIIKETYECPLFTIQRWKLNWG